MNKKVRILTITKCSPKEGNPYTRLDFVPLGDTIKSSNVKGSIVAPAFITGHDAFDKIPESIINQEVEIELDFEPNARNLMKPRTIIKTIITKNGNISLL